jgi:hypothetical protein
MATEARLISYWDNSKSKFLKISDEQLFKLNHEEYNDITSMTHKYDGSLTYVKTDNVNKKLLSDLASKYKMFMYESKHEIEFTFRKRT